MEDSILLEFFSTWSYAIVQGTLKGAVRVTSCLTDLDMCICAVQNSVHPAQTHISKPVKQEVNCTLTLPPLSVPCFILFLVLGL